MENQNEFLKQFAEGIKNGNISILINTFYGTVHISVIDTEGNILIEK
jgi:gamma-glutamyltranspeptidase